MQKKKLTKKRLTATKRKPAEHPIRRVMKFLPAILILAAASNIHGMPKSTNVSPTKQVLSYATSMNTSDLLNSTNSQRTGNGEAALSLNEQLNNAAQTKANDMVTRNYWSHTTPDGDEPWVFISNAGYQYKTAGENLAYGFDNGSDTITGWMNSPPHRKNLLNSAFIDVGFGFANSVDYINNGPQTVVVAMYAAPLVQQTAPTAPVQAAPPTPATKPAVQQSAIAPAPKPVAVAVAASEPIETAPVQVVPVVQSSATEPVQTTAKNAVQTANATPTVASTATVRRIQVLTGGNAAWSSTLLVLSLGSVGVLWVLQRGLQLRRVFLRGERYVLHHFHLDLTVISLFVLAGALLQTTGVVR